MKCNVARWIVFVLLSHFMLGCTSIRARTEVLHNDQWTVYPGVQQDIKEIGQLATGEHSRSLSDDDSEPGWIKGMIATILAIDLPFSTVFDTLVVPYDIYRTYNPQKFKDARSDSSQFPKGQKGTDGKVWENPP